MARNPAKNAPRLRLSDPKVRRRLEEQARMLAQAPDDPEILVLLDACLAEIEGWTI